MIRCEIAGSEVFFESPFWVSQYKPLDSKSIATIQLSHSDSSPLDHKRRFSENLVVTKKEIVKAISEELGLTQLKTKEIVQKTFDAIVETLVTDRRIELRNFGVFEVKKRAARKARNPRTGGQVEVPAKFVVTFKPGKEMEERVLQLEEEEFAREQAAKAAANAAESTSQVGGLPPLTNHGPGSIPLEPTYRPPAGPAPHSSGG